MSIEETAQALSTDTATPVDAPVDTAEVSEDSEMETLFDSMNGADDPEPDEVEQEAEPEVEKATDDDAREHQHHIGAIAKQFRD